MLIQTQSTLRFQIFCKIILHFQVIDKSVKDPDVNFKSNSNSLKG